MDDSDVRQVKPGHIPLIGRLTLAELVGFTILALGAIAAVLGLSLFLPLTHDISAPGSGGGAQMLMAMFVFPAIAFCGLLLLSAVIGFVLLAGSTRRRLRSRHVLAVAMRGMPADEPSSAVPAIDLAAAERAMTALTVTLCVQMAALAMAVFATSADLNVALGLVQILAAFVFLILLGVVAADLGRNWPVWVLLTLITPPFGPFVAYFLIRDAVMRARRAVSQHVDR